MDKRTLSLIILFYIFNCSFLQLHGQVLNSEKSTIYYQAPDSTLQEDFSPIISIVAPKLIGDTVFNTTKLNIEIQGIIRKARGIKEVYINDLKINISEHGTFQSDILLAEGTNKFVIKVTNQIQFTSTKEFIINREIPVLSYKTTEKPNIEINGNLSNVSYHALIIGINEYLDISINDLNNAVLDATVLYKTLTELYTFDEPNIIYLKNPNRADIILALDKLSNKLTPYDNLLIFYAGHGHWDSNRETGYWLPSDANQLNTVNWLRNTTIQSYIDDINTSHTLLISDACFSGSIFKTRRAFYDASIGINKLYSLPSRKAMTSGALKEVPDRSVFIEYLIKRLQQNQNKYLSSEQLFTSFREAVLNNSPNVPQYGVVQDTGDEGGDFIFIKR